MDGLKTTFLVCWIAGGVIRAYGVRKSRSHRRKRGGVVDDRTSPWEYALLFLVVAGMQLAPLVYIFSPWLDFADYAVPAVARPGLAAVGVGVFAAALWLLWRSHVDLGQNWSMKLQIRRKQTLVTGGVFRRIRHPMYAAHWLWAVAQALLLQNWIAGPAFLVAFVPLYMFRVPREERMMLDRFGDEYRAYMNGTGRVLPRLWS